jgi:hypothetical protein
MTRINSIEKLKGKSRALEQIAEDYLHLAQGAAGEVDTVRKKRHAELLQLARQIELLSRIPMTYQFPNPTAFYLAWEKWDDEFSRSEI